MKKELDPTHASGDVDLNAVRDEVRHQQAGGMTKERRHEIAYLYVARKLRKEGFHLDQNFRRDIGNTAKDLGITLNEALEFIEPFAREQFEKTFEREV
jgi:hypothetical protein